MDNEKTIEEQGQGESIEIGQYIDQINRELEKQGAVKAAQTVPVTPIIETAEQPLPSLEMQWRQQRKNAGIVLKRSTNADPALMKLAAGEDGASGEGIDSAVDQINRQSYEDAE